MDNSGAKDAIIPPSELPVQADGKELRCALSDRRPLCSGFRRSRGARVVAAVGPAMQPVFPPSYQEIDPLARALPRVTPSSRASAVPSTMP